MAGIGETGFSFTGTDAMRRRIALAGQTIRERLAAALYAEAQAIMRDSKDRFVPVDEGVLRASGGVDLPQFKGREISVRLYFGGAASAYAAAVHEHPSVYSPPSWRGKAVQFHPEGRGPKYLWTPMKLRMRGMAGRISARIFAGSGGQQP